MNIVIYGVTDEQYLQDRGHRPVHRRRAHSRKHPRFDRMTSKSSGEFVVLDQVDTVTEE